MSALSAKPQRAMKTCLLLFALMLTVIQAAPITEITTLWGQTFRRCEIVRVHPDGVFFTHSRGAAKILFTDLSASWRSRLGYDPAKAATYQIDINVGRKQIADARERQDAELSRAFAEAERLSRIRQLALAAQADAARQAVANSIVVPAYPVLPALGAVYDSRSYRQRGGLVISLPYSTGCYYPHAGFGPYGLGWGLCTPPPLPYCLPVLVRRSVIRR